MDKILVDKSVLEKALEALEYENSWHEHHKVKPYVSTIDAITALRAALAQQEQEPVAWLLTGGSDVYLASEFCPGSEHVQEWTPLYTHPPRREWQGLTNPDIARVFRAVYGGARFGPSEKEFAIAVEDALKVKNNR
jgi:hypothetical protein